MKQLAPTYNLDDFFDVGYGGGGGYTKPVYDPIQTIDPVENTQAMIKTVKVTDHQGTPLPGAHVYFTQSNGQVTNFDGNATLSATSNFIETHISYMGFKTQTYPFGSLPAVVQLQPAENSLDAVVITANKKTPKYLVPALLALGGLICLMGFGGPPAPEGGAKNPRTSPLAGQKGKTATRRGSRGKARLVQKKPKPVTL